MKRFQSGWDGGLLAGWLADSLPHFLSLSHSLVRWMAVSVCRLLGTTNLLEDKEEKKKKRHRRKEDNFHVAHDAGVSLWQTGEVRSFFCVCVGVFVCLVHLTFLIPNYVLYPDGCCAGFICLAVREW